MSDTLTLDALVEEVAEAQWEAARAGLCGQRYAFLDVPWSEAPADLRAVELGCARAALAAVAKAAGTEDDRAFVASMLVREAADREHRGQIEGPAAQRRVAALLRTLAEAAP